MKYKTIRAVAVLATAGLAVYAAHDQNKNIKIRNIDISHEHIPTPFDGFRIVQVSDLHNTRFGRKQRQLINKIKLLQPDILLISGDLIDRKRSKRHNLAPMMELIEQAVEIAPVYYVPGNHEATSAIYPYVKEYLVSKEVHILENSKVELLRNETSITLLGLKDPKFYPYDKKKFEENLHAIRQTVDTPFCMLLSHRPEFFSLYASESIHLSFCGHAHGGQVCIPNVGGLYAPDQGLLPKYTDGLYQEGESSMVVSRGLGNSRAPLRINDHPQLVCVTLYAE